MSAPDVVCPACEAVIPPDRVDWVTAWTRCAACGEELSLDGDLWPREASERWLARALAPRELPARPDAHLRIAATSAGVEVTLGRRYSLAHARVAMDASGVRVSSRLGRSAHVALRSLRGFLVVQEVVGGVAPLSRWWVRTLEDGGTSVRVFAWDEEAPARYTCSELNRVLGRIREQAPYR